jgi:hypothetical protein
VTGFLERGAVLTVQHGHESPLHSDTHGNTERHQWLAHERNFPKGREPSIRTLCAWAQGHNIPHHRVGHFVYYDLAYYFITYENSHYLVYKFHCSLMRKI